VKTYEEHNLKIPELEKKIRSQKTSYKKELKNMEVLHQEKMKSLDKKINHLEEMLKKNVTPNAYSRNTISNENYRTHNSNLHINSKLNEDDLDRVNVSLKFIIKII